MNQIINRIVLFCFLFLFFSKAYAQTSIVSLEYWFDNLLITKKTVDTQGKSINFNQLDVGSLSEGMHTLYLRAKDSNGNWSITHSKLIYNPIQQEGNSGCEYWIDNSNHMQFVGSQSNQITSFDNIDLQSVSSGIHTLYIRSRNKAGVEGITHAILFYKTQTTNGEIGCEYWIDEEVENKKAVPTNGSSPVTINNIDISHTSAGVHTLYIRAKSKSGAETITHSILFYKPEDPDGKIGYEYWVDEGIENRKRISISGNKTASLNRIDLNSINEGFHLLHIRAVNHAGVTSTIGSYPFFKNKNGIAQIKAYRYWYDSNFEAHSLVELTEAVNPYELKEKKVLPVEFAQGEKHTFHTQFQDLSGKWSIATTDSFKIVPLFSENEFVILKAFYKSTHGELWKNTLAGDAAWDTTSIASVNDWKGVIIHNGSVTGIELPENNLTGIVPSGILAELPNLKTVDVSSNSIESLSEALPKTISPNIKSQFFDKGIFDATLEEDLIVSLSGISLYNHSGSNFDTNARFDLHINGVYKTRITSANGSVTVPKSYLSDLVKNDLLTLVQYNGDATGTVYQYTADGITIDVSSISLNKPEIRLLVGESETLTYTITPSNATNRNVIWGSNAEDVATVSPDGLVTAHKEGMATVSVTTEDNQKTATCQITVLLPSGIHQNQNEIIAVYPNPVKDFFVVKQAIGKRLTVYSPLGNKIHEQKILDEEELIESKHWDNGVYILLIYDKNEVKFTDKLIKK